MKRIAALFVVLSFGLSFVGARAASAPSNDNRSNAADVGAVPGVSTVNPSTATQELGEDISCGGPLSVWYSWRAPSADPLTIQVVAQFPDPFGGGSGAGIHVYNKVRSVLTSVGCGTGNFTFTPTSGAHYLIQVEGPSQTVNVYFQHGPYRGGTTLANADNIIAPPFPFQEIVGLAGNVNGPTPTCAVPGGAYWYAFTADSTNVYDVHLDAVEPAYYQVYKLDASGNPQPVVGGCGSTLAPDQGADSYIPMLAGDKIYVQYGWNVDPAAFDDGGVAYGFFTLAPAAS